MLKAFGVYNQAEPVLLAFLAPLGESSAEVSRWIIKSIDNLNAGVLGSIGLALLIYTVVSLLQKIEESLNFIWHVAQMRSFPLRFSGFGVALAGGTVPGALWQLAAWTFATFVVESTQYAAIHSTLAILVLFLFWLYLSWLILLLGARKDPGFAMMDGLHRRHASPAGAAELPGFPGASR